MAAFETPAVDVLSVPLGDLIASVGRGVADAQREMDAASIALLQEVYSSSEGLLNELQRIGYRPNWYHIPEAQGDIQVALTVTGEQSTSGPPAAGRPRVKMYAAPIDAGYTARFNFTVQAASRVTFRIVPVPPSSAAESVRVVPSLVGLSISQAQSLLTLLGIPVNIGSTPPTAVVTGQNPPAGSILPPDGSVSLQPFTE
jgi:PASTA domain